MADDSPAPDADAAAEEARSKAEARRQRILEKSRERMGVVAGETAPTESAENDDGEPSTASAPQPSGASRMQAMRRRRFKKTAPSQKKEGESKEMGTTDQPLARAELVASAEAESVATSAVDTNEETAAQTTIEAETTPPEALNQAQTEAPPSAKAPSQETVENTTTNVSQETKKKYKGVAKMRREMIKKKEKEAAEAKAAESKAVASVPLLRKPPVSRIPILIHLFAVLLLFFAGVDIGWNQVVLSDVTIYHNLTPKQDGIGLWNRYLSLSSQSSMVLDPSKLQETKNWWSRDEFVSSEREDVDVYVLNIDPLFRVDLDKLTEGGGAFNTVAKGAINIHRLNLKIFYYLPRSIMQTLAAIPQQLLATPPILCMISLIVRQTAKLIFGAKLPDPALDKKDSKDVLAMMKQSISNFLAGMFPTAVSLYDVWTHLRSDMYVILCGVFCGLAYTHFFLVEVGDDRVVSSGNDEL